MPFRRFSPTLSFALLAAICTPLAPGYVRTTTSDVSGTPLVNGSATGLQMLMNTNLVAGLTNSQVSCATSANAVLAANSDPVGAARNALATWNGVGASVNFLPLQSTTSITTHAYDGNNVIVLATDAADVSALGGTCGKGGALAVTLNTYYTTSGVDQSGPYSAGTIVDSDIVLNPSITFSTDGTGSGSGVQILNGNTTSDLQAVLTHELGHVLGASHTGVWGATMFQFAALGERFPGTDDLAFVRSLYPPPGAAANSGAIQGTITLSTGAPASYSLLTFIDTSQNITVGALTAVDGTYSTQLPAGSYLIVAEPFNSLVQPGNLYLTSGEAAIVAKFPPTVFGGASSPTTTAVAAGGTATATFSVASGVSTLALPLVGFGGAGKTSDIATFSAISAPQIVPSGGSLDMAFTGTGFDSTLTTSDFQVFGGGVTIVPNSLRKDTPTVNGLPVYRLTLNIATSPADTMASIFIAKGANTLSMSGGLFVTPPQPAFISKGVINAASYLGSGGFGAVSPGGIYSIYAGAAPVGPATGVVNGGFDAYKHLPATLAGVTVYFDGVAAPLFYVSGGQINVQVPFEVAAKIGSMTSVVVDYYGASSAPVSVPVFADQPGFFTITALGKDSLVFNQDGTLNTAANPAKQSSFVTIYGTGVGGTTIGAAAYGLETGVAAPAPPSGYGNGNFNCTVGGTTTVPAYFGGWTPTTVGLAQWDLEVPAGATGSFNLQCTDAGTGSGTQIGTIYVN